MNNRIKNFEGWSTSSEEAPEYFGTIGALSFKNENIMCDIRVILLCGIILGAIMLVIVMLSFFMFHGMVPACDFTGREQRFLPI